MVKTPNDTYTLIIVGETEKAFKVAISLAEKEAAVWLPKSQIDITKIDHPREGNYPVVDICIPDWLAERAGLS